MFRRSIGILKPSNCSFVYETSPLPKFKLPNLASFSVPSRSSHKAFPKSQNFKMTGSRPTALPADIDPSLLPPGYSAIQERNAIILHPGDNTAFYNPIQQFNRDISVAVIKRWMDLHTDEMKTKWEDSMDKMVGKRNRKKMKNDLAKWQTKVDKALRENLPPPPKPEEPNLAPKAWKQPRFTVLEGLSATGLRAVRYAQELPKAGIILANDMSPGAVLAMKQNIAFNDVGAIEIKPIEKKVSDVGAEEQPEAGPSTGVKKETEVEEEEKSDEFVARGYKKKRFSKGGVVVNQMDACELLYAHRIDLEKVDVVDLDPYGTASPFIDGAVQAVIDGGLLCVTCTDLAVMAGGNYPEKCYSNYGGMPVKGEFTHEGALRMALHTIATSAARLGRTIIPLVSLSIDYYIRVFVRVVDSPLDTKMTASKTGIVYICTYCQAQNVQPFGRAVKRADKDLYDYKCHSGPPVNTGGCQHCGQTLMLAGPMWLGPLQNQEFIEGLLESLENDKDNYGTFSRMKGMLSMARDELPDMFYFTPAKVAGFFHAQCPKLDLFNSAILNAGYSISRSHAIPGSIKTNAPRQFIFDVMREFIKTTPVRRDKINAGSPAFTLLDRPQMHEVNFKLHPDVKGFGARKELVRYQLNPQPNWGPASKAKSAAPVKPVEKVGANGSALPVKIEGYETGMDDEDEEDAENGDAADGGDEDTTVANEAVRQVLDASQVKKRRADEDAEVMNQSKKSRIEEEEEEMLNEQL